MRSATSAGGSWKTSSRGRKRYSIGSGNSFAAMNITESLPSWAEQVVHAQQRAEGVAVGPLVGGEQEAVARAQLGGDQLDVGGRQSGRLPGHPCSSSRREIRTPCSIVSS